MPVDQSLTGRSFTPGEPYEVTHERIAEFARATGSEYDGRTAPVTFPIVVVFAALGVLMSDPDLGISLHRVVHGEQRFTYTRPIVAGDRLAAVLTVESLRQIGGADIIKARSELTAGDAQHVCTASTTLVHRAET